MAPDWLLESLHHFLWHFTSILLFHYNLHLYKSHVEYLIFPNYCIGKMFNCQSFLNLFCTYVFKMCDGETV